jgi:large conductance mechanosensitive channel
MSRNLEEKFWVMRKGPHYSNSAGYNTRQQAIDDGAVILTYGWVVYILVN